MLTDPWGVALGFERRLRAMGVTTSRQYRDADTQSVRKKLGVVGQRIVLELWVCCDTPGPLRREVILRRLARRSRVQPNLFDQQDHARLNRLMVCMDRINRDWGRGTLRLASASSFSFGPGRTWHLRCDHRSPRYTTRWDELPVAYALG